MFTWLNKQGVQSDSGFIVQFAGRFTAEYREGGKIMTVALKLASALGSPVSLVVLMLFNAGILKIPVCPIRSGKGCFAISERRVSFRG